MSSPNLQTRHQRSHSASDSSSSSDEHLRSSKKRSHYSSTSLSDPSPVQKQKRDADVRRLGKRRRRELSPTIPGADRNAQGTPCFSGNQHTATAPRLPASSAAFNFIPAIGQGSHRSQRPLHPFDSIPSAEFDTCNRAGLARLKSKAFWELHRSVAENGEGFVRRMREYEHSRSRLELYHKAKEAQKKGRKRSSISILPLRQVAPMDASDLSEDEEDIQIFAGDVANTPSQKTRHKKRTLSLNLMDVDTLPIPFTPFSAQDSVGSSPGTASSSVFLSDDEQQNVDTTSDRNLFSNSHSRNASSIPVLSHSLPDSMNSSFASLPSPPSSRSVLPLDNGSNTCTPSLTSSEKAIAALSLAFANGAGSLSDYSALGAIQDLHGPSDCDMGELWR